MRRPLDGDHVGQFLVPAEVLVFLGTCCRLGEAKRAGDVIIGIDHECDRDDDPDHVHELFTKAYERNASRTVYIDLRRGRPRGRAGLR